MAAVNCATFSGDTLKSIFFGHEAGSFTGATKRQIGILEAAQGGTLFLDELGELPLEAQKILLRVLDGDFEYRRMGSTKTLIADVRIISATNIDLEQAVRRGAFREDLYHRLNTSHIESPQLVSHLDDIPLIVDHHLAKRAEIIYNQTGTQGVDVELGVYGKLLLHEYPGNVRELINIIDRALISMKREPNRITADDITFQKFKPIQSKTIAALEERGIEVAPGYHTLKTYDDKMKYFDSILILDALNNNNWERQVTAEKLGINRTTLYKKIKAYELNATSMIIPPADSPLSERVNHGNYNEALEECSIFILLKALEEFPKASRDELAAELGFNRTTLFKKLKAHDLNHIRP